MKITTLVPALAIVALSTQYASASLLVYDGFEAGGATPGAGQYETGTGFSSDSLAGQSPTLLGFDTTAWANIDAVSSAVYPRANPTGLGYSDGNALSLQTKVGGSEIFRSGSGSGIKRVERSLDGSSLAAGSSMYASALFQFTAGTAGDIRLTTSFDSGTFDGTRESVLGFNSSGQLIAGTSSTVGNSGATTYAADTTHFVIVEFSSSASSGSRTVNVWVNPSDLTSLGSATHTWNGDFYSEVNGADLLKIQLGSATGNDSSFLIDEIRVGSTLESVVVPVPEPASLALMGLGGLLMLGRSRRD